MRGVAGNRWFFRRGLWGVYWDFAPIWLGLLFLIAACADPGPERTAAVDAGIGREDPRSGTPAALEQGLAAYARVLGRLVRSGCLDLAALEEDAAIASDLAAARLLLGQVAPHELPVAARLPFWIDLHNLCLLEGLLAGLQQDPDFHVGWYTFDLLRERRCPVGGAVLTLTEIVSGVRGVPDPLADRPFAQTFPTQVDPRVHCALYQGARSGPSLPALPLSGDEAEVRLARACSRWLNHPWRGAGPDGLSASFSW